MDDVAAYIGLVALFVSVGGLIVSIITARSSVHQSVIEALQVRIAELEKEVVRWEKRYRHLLNWVREQGLIPPWV